MRRKIRLDPEQMTDRDSMSTYFDELFTFPEYFGRNLDALYDCLCEVEEYTDFILTQQTTYEIVSDAYGYKVLRVLSDAVKENPHMRILFK